jgi:hypothetical protein
MARGCPVHITSELILRWMWLKNWLNGRFPVMCSCWMGVHGIRWKTGLISNGINSAILTRLDLCKKLRALGIRVNLWEYSYLSTVNPLFNVLAEKGFFLKNPDGTPYIHRWLPWPYDEYIPHLMPSGLIDFTNPEAYAWFRDQHEALFKIGRECDEDRLR